MDKLKEIVEKLNSIGIKLPMLTDPKTSKASVSLTMLFISFNLCILAMVGKWAKIFDGIDPSQALNLFMVSAGLYFGRGLQNNGKAVNLDENKKESNDQSN